MSRSAFGRHALEAGRRCLPLLRSCCGRRCHRRRRRNQPAPSQRPTRSRRSRNSPGSSSSSRTAFRSSTSGSRIGRRGRPLDQCRARAQGDRGAARAGRHRARRGLRQRHGLAAWSAALAHAREKLRTLEQDTRFRPEERQFLIEQWRRLRVETERATEELAAARKEFADLLRTLQANEDFVDELVQIRQAQKALEVIQRLTQDIREANDQLKRLIGGIKPPGA